MQVLFPQQQQPSARDMHDPRNITVPFLHNPIGLGDAVAHLTQAVGITPCQPCQERQERLNQAFRLNPYR